MGSEAKSELVIRRLTREAAKLGANGLWLQGIREGKSRQFDAGVGSERDSAHGTIKLGLGGATLFETLYGRRMAIYLAPSTSTGLPEFPVASGRR